MAQTETLLECKVSLKRVEGFVCRNASETPISMPDEVAAMLPLRSVNSVREMEEKLEAEDFVQATVIKSLF